MKPISLLICWCLFNTLLGQGKITGIEFWYDQNDNSRVYQPVSQSTNAYLNTIQDFAVTTLHPGYHNGHFRLKDTEGQWSSVVSWPFFLQAPTPNTLSKLRMWSDPNIHPTDLIEIDFTPLMQYVTLSDLIDLCKLSTSGTKQVFFQLGDTSGNWSSIVSKLINVDVVGLPPADPSSIIGDPIICVDSTYSYAVLPSTGAVHYHWLIPLQWEWIEDSLIDITISPADIDGSIKVYASNACGNSDTTSLFIQVDSGIPASPGVILGPIEACANSVLTYSVDSVMDAHDYIWSFPPGWSIENAPTPLSREVRVGTQSGEVKVAAMNSCGTSAETSLQTHITPAKPSIASMIEGPVNVCTDSIITYSVTEDPLAEEYHWVFPGDWTLLDSISPNQLQFLTGEMGGIIEVYATNICGVSDTQQLLIHLSQDIPLLSDTIQGNLKPCNGSTEPYEIPFWTDATNFNWDVPDTWSIASTPDSQLIVAIVGNLGGTISLSATNGCGVNSVSLNVSVPVINIEVDTQNNVLTALETDALYQWVDCSNGQPVAGETNAVFIPAISGQYQVIILKDGCPDTSACYPVTITSLTDVSFRGDISVYPNPSNGSFFISHIGVRPHFSLFDMLGRAVSIESDNDTDKTLIRLYERVSGLYILEIYHRGLPASRIPVIIQFF